MHASRTFYCCLPSEPRRATHWEDRCSEGGRSDVFGSFPYRECGRTARDAVLSFPGVLPCDLLLLDPSATRAIPSFLLPSVVSLLLSRARPQLCSVRMRSFSAAASTAHWTDMPSLPNAASSTISWRTSGRMHPPHGAEKVRKKFMPVSGLCKRSYPCRPKGFVSLFAHVTGRCCHGLGVTAHLWSIRIYDSDRMHKAAQAAQAVTFAGVGWMPGM